MKERQMTYWLHILVMQMISINSNSSKEVLKNPTIDFNALFNSLGNSTCNSPGVVLAFLLYEGSTIRNASDQFVSCVSFFFVDFAFHPSPKKKSDLYAPTSNSCISTPNENWTHVYMNLFTRKSPYYHLLKYLLFLLKHLVHAVQCCFATWKVNSVQKAIDTVGIRCTYNRTNG
jgi:hypothetical protein